MTINGRRFQCSACKHKVSKGRLMNFLRCTKCCGQQARPTLQPWGELLPQAPMEAYHIGKARVHPSHSLASARGVLFCTSCGSWSTHSLGCKSCPKGLKAVCKPPTHVGKEALRRLRKGQPPKAGFTWPDDRGPMSHQAADFSEEGGEVEQLQEMELERIDNAEEQLNDPFADEPCEFFA